MASERTGELRKEGKVGTLPLVAIGYAWVLFTVLRVHYVCESGYCMLGCWE